MGSVDGLLAWLLTYAVHSTLMLGAAWLIARRTRSPAIRDVLWKTALIAGIVTSLGQSAGLSPVVGRYEMASTTRVAVDPIPPISRRPELATAPRIKLASPSQESDRPPFLASLTPAAWIIGAWLLIAIGLVGSLAISRWRLGRQLGRRPASSDRGLRSDLAALMSEAGIGRTVKLTVSERLPSPIAVGLSEICVPSRAVAQLDPSERRSMLAHELAHLVRYDPIWLTIAALIERVAFFQPLNRLARRRIQAEAEFLCDEWAAAQTGSGVTMAKCLVIVAEWMDAAPRPIPLAGLAEERSQLVNRVQRLMEERAMSVKPERRMVFVGALALVVVAVLVAPQVALVGQDPKPPRPAVAAMAVRAPRVPGVVAVAPAIGAVGLGPARASMGMLAAREDRGRRGDTTGTVVPALVAALKDPSPEVRRAAAQSLGQIGDRRATSGLLGVLGDDDPGVRTQAIEALGELQDPRAIEALGDRLKDPVKEVRRAAFSALSHFSENLKPELFRPWVADPDPEIRAATAEILGRLEDHASVGALVRMLGDSKAEVRRAAAEALGQLKDRGSADAVSGLLRDADPEVRMAAINSLGNFELTEAPAAVLTALGDDHGDVRQAAANLVGNIGDRRAVPALRSMLTDRVADVREAAVEALSSIRDQSAIDALVAALKSTDPVVRKAAAQALGER